MREESPRVGSLDKICHKQAGDREKDRDADDTETAIESGCPAGIAEMCARKIRRVVKRDEQGSQGTQGLNREILVSDCAGPSVEVARGPRRVEGCGKCAGWTYDGPNALTIGVSDLD